MTKYLYYAAFFVGLAAICWVGAGYIGSNPIALAITLLIGAFYLIGARELLGFQQATLSLTDALADLSAPPASLGAWLDRLHPSLQNAVRLRIEGERVGLPGPALTPYITGLLVLLGMLGTFVGMVVTLSGTGSALENAADLQAIRSSLAAPVRGLGLAFGTSLAGVASSAMLGLLSALCRRERMQAGQRLDSRIASSLRVFSQAHQREESFKLLERQGAAMPELMDRLQAMMSSMERQSQTLNERLLLSQDRFHDEAEATYTNLAVRVGQALERSLTESARTAGASIQPIVEATMSGIARETAALQQAIEHGVQRQLEGLTSRVETSSQTVAALWHKALAEQQHSSVVQAENLRAALDQFTAHFEQRSGALVASVSSQLEDTVGNLSESWRSALAAQEQVGQKLSDGTQGALTAAAESFAQQATALVQNVGQAHADLQTEIATRDQQRLSAWTLALEQITRSLQQEWQQAGDRTQSQQQAICQTLAETANQISAQTEAHAKSTINEIAQLMQAAAQAPQAAAELIAELRQQLSDSMVRDNALLDERSRILQTLDSLLGTVNHAATEQRSAIDTLISSSTELLERVGTDFTNRIETESEKMSGAAAQMTGSAVEVASLGESFGFGVQLFSDSNDKLVAQLQRIEAALGKSMARSDEQLEYYVAQAREVIDLSIMSQKQIVEELQQVAAERQTEGSQA